MERKWRARYRYSPDGGFEAVVSLNGETFDDSRAALSAAKEAARRLNEGLAQETLRLDVDAQEKSA